MGPTSPASRLAAGKHCACAICRTHLEFSVDDHLLSEIERHNGVIFAGAGISTEQRLAYPDTFYDQIRADLGIQDNPPFPELMQLYEEQPNGRQKLISKIIDRFKYIDSFADARKIATGFHRELATMPYLSRIITTNWDRYFEDIAAATPFVYESDVPFWEIAKRAVLKIHGSVDNYASIVATTEDYQYCERRLVEGTIGAVLKQIFATKTCIFVGYSAKDSDFVNIYTAVQRGLGAFQRTHYLVSPYIDDDDVSRLLALNIVPIRTDGTYFLSVIKDHMCGLGLYARDETYDETLQMFLRVNEEHLRFSKTFSAVNHPHLVCALFYQDGLEHGLERIVDLRKTGEYSDLHRLGRIIAGYDEKITTAKRQRDYLNLSYFQGYQNALIYFLIINDPGVEDDAPLPFYYHPGVGEIYDYDEYSNTVRENPAVHKGALAQCTRAFKAPDFDESIIPQHPPWG